MRLKSRLLCASILATLGAAALPAGTAAAQAPAQRQQMVVLDIPAGPASTGLNTLATQADVQLFYPFSLVSGRQLPAIKGEYARDEAIRLVAEAVGLRVTRQGDAYALDADPQGGSAATGGATVEALIVTAQKREEDIQDVPIAISAFSQEDLTRSQVAGGPDLMTQVPNFTFTKTNFSSYSIQIRGIGTQAISATTDAAVAVALNNTPFIRNRFFEQEFYDLQRVEVLRGPQGTLYGRNATAGVVNIISNKPSFGYEAKLSGDVANYNSTRLEGMINLPLVEDIVALRVAGAWTKREGYSTNEITGNPIDGRDLWSTRVSLRFAPTETLDVNLIWEHFREDDDRLRSGKQLCKRDVPTEIGGVAIPYGAVAPGSNNGMIYEQFYSQGCSPASLYSPDSFQAPQGLRLPYYRPLFQLDVPVVFQNPDGSNFDPYASISQSRDLRVIESTVDPRYRAETNLAELQFSLDLTDHLTLTSETGYLSDTLFSTQDYNRFNTRSGAFRHDATFSRAGIMSEPGVFCDPQIGCADRVVAVDLSTADSRHFSQELRIASDYEGPFNFSLGANFLRYDTEDKYYVFINTLTMTAAIGMFAGPAALPAWNPGVSDNHECFRKGLREPDTQGVLGVGSCTFIDPNPIDSLTDEGHNYFLSKNPYKLISYAVFGESYYQLSETLKLTAGLRWTVDKKEAPRVPSWVLGADAIGYPVAEVIEQEWREPTGRLTLDWKPDTGFTDETLLYASYAHGYKAGGANPPANGLVMYGQSVEGIKADWALIAAAQQAVAPTTFEPEFIDAFEIGSKNTLLDGEMTLNAAAFYYDYEGYQISQIINRSAINSNFDAKVWGLEIEADWRPLENLRFGLKAGYENTEMADGSRAVDTMDRANGGLPDENGVSWFVTGPFPSLPSNCILPTYTVVHPDGELAVLGASSGGNLGPCEAAYVLGLDPITNLPYVPDPVTTGSVPSGYFYPGYPGFDPSTAPNGGAGFYKDLSGNELPNAPHFTTTLTADYTLPLPSDWLMTLHTDLYYQSEAWTRVFNTEGYDKLKAYTNVNLAAIFTNEDAGWKVMAYIKNVFDRDSITGAFLNSDDTGLTTNVFLTEPRLYGLRVTKDWNGGPWWTGANPSHRGPYPLTVELGGQVQNFDADYATLTPSFADEFSTTLASAIADPQHRELDTGDSREIRLVWRQPGTPWKVAAGWRYGRANNDRTRIHADEPAGPLKCAFIAFLNNRCNPASPLFIQGFLESGTNFIDSAVKSREEYDVVDFAVGRDVGIGLLGLDRSSLSIGMRYASFESTTDVEVTGVPDWFLPDNWYLFATATKHQYEATLEATREFQGTGPMISWDAAKQLFGDEDTGHVDLDWSLNGGVLFGKQEAAVTGEEESGYFRGRYYFRARPLTDIVTTPVNIARSDDVSVPVIDVSLGVAYEIGRIKLSTGYRWERYFDVLDVGDDEAEGADRTLDGPYFKIAVGFGG